MQEISGSLSEVIRAYSDHNLIVSHIELRHREQ